MTVLIKGGKVFDHATSGLERTDVLIDDDIAACELSLDDVKVILGRLRKFC